MKKFISSLCAVLVVFAFVSCADSNKTLARNIEKNVTNMVYAANKLETISVDTTKKVADTAIRTNEYNYSKNNAKFTNENAPIIIITDTTQIQDSNSLIRSSQTLNNPNRDIISRTQLPISNTISTNNKENTQNLNSVTGLRNNTPSNNNQVTVPTKYNAPQLISNNLNVSNTTKELPANNTNTLAKVNNQTKDITAPSASLPFVGSYDATIIINSTTDTAGKVSNMNNKRNVIMLYSSDLANGEVSLTSTEKQAITEYIGIIEETTNFFKQNRGMLDKQMNHAQNMSQESTNMVNSKLIRATETLKNRYAKFDSGIAAMESIIGIIENKATNNYTNTQPKTNTAVINDTLTTTPAQVTTNNNKTANNTTINPVTPVVPTTQTTNNQTTVNNGVVKSVPSLSSNNVNATTIRPLSPTIDNGYNYPNTNYVTNENYPRASKPYRTSLPIASSTNAPVNKHIVVKNMPYVTSNNTPMAL